MVKQYKIDKVKELREVFDKNSSYIFTDYKGLTVEKFTNIRHALRKFNSKMVVVKNNYIRIIAEDKKLPNMDEFLTGTTAVVFSNDDANEVTKVLFNFTKESPLKVKGGYTDGFVMDGKQVEAFSKLPGKKQLIGTVMATMNAPLQNFMFACNDVMGRLVRVVDAVAQQKKSAG